MSQISKRRLLCVASLLSVFIAIIHILNISNNRGTEEELFPIKDNRIARFLVSTSGCKIPDIDPFDSSIRHLVMKSRSIHCNATPAITFVDKDFLRINKTALELFYREDLESCLYQTIHRSTQATDDLYTYGNETRWFQKDVRIPDEFIRVACYGTEGSLLYTNFHAMIHRKVNVEKRCAKQSKQFKEKHKRRPNVIIVGVDSVSRLNFIRQMPNTRRFLLNNLSAVELLGYNKVADNTYVNLVPMFSGKFVSELPWDETMNTPFDRYNFIWKNYSERGYRTLYAEDAPKIAIFNYAKEGFHKSPADYYLRPLSLAMEEHGSIWNTNHDCVGPRLETQVVLDYMSAFLDTFKKGPYYAFSFITRLTHDGINKVGAADEPYYQFLTNIQKKGHLRNSVLIFFSDHGMRFGSIRETYVGKLEERLPFMLLVFPTWFPKEYPKLYRNLQTNRRRLTTPFDIYETLVDILNLQKVPRDSSVMDRGISLFSQIPEERTCEHAAILEHWCTCHEQIQVLTMSHTVTSAARYVVGEINKIITLHKGLCAELFLKAVVDARKIVANQKMFSFQESLHDVIRREVTYNRDMVTAADYMLTFRTSPGDGLFEVTVRIADNAYKVIGELSRINAYGDSGSCIQIHSHMKYCHCQ